MHDTIPFNKDSAFGGLSRWGRVLSPLPSQRAFPCHLIAAGTLHWLCSNLNLPSSSSQLSNVQFLMRQKDNLHQGNESVGPSSAASCVPACSPNRETWPAGSSPCSSPRFCRRGTRCLEPQSVMLMAVGRLQHSDEEAQPVVFLGTVSDSGRTQVKGSPC